MTDQWVIESADGVWAVRTSELEAQARAGRDAG